jgi:acyl-coenzyme A thioesterase PaaI-like protein
MTVTAGEGLTVIGDFLVSEHHQGAPGLAHGGLLTAAIDEVLGSLNWLLSDPAVTARLECEFRRPVPVGSRLHIHAEIVGVKGRKVFTRAIGRLNDKDGPIAISAAALFVQVPLEHFVTHGTAEHVQLAIDDRAAGGPAWRPEGDADQRAVEVNP